jgi:succinate dehydrogenase / fumarate reductase, iron-sulfur subunit
MGEGGVADCGKAQNCARVCPKEIPLTERHRASWGCQTNKQALIKDLFGS